ncbi:MAG: hypothetical protein ACLFR7_07295, partial [Opitutales bacterium]
DLRDSLLGFGVHLRGLLGLRDGNSGKERAAQGGKEGNAYFLNHTKPLLHAPCQPAEKAL